MAKGKHQRSKAAKIERSLQEQEHDAYIQAWLDQLRAATVRTLETGPVRALVIKGLKTNPSVFITEELVEQIVGLVVDQWKGPGDTKWSQGVIDIQPNGVRYIRKR